MTTTKINEVSKIYLSIFILLGILFIPFSWNLFTFQSAITEFLFASVVEILLKATDSQLGLMDFSSDSTSLYFLLGLLMIISLILTFFVLKLNENFRAKVISAIASIAGIYLSFILLKYGFDKLFKTQFNLPEPNLLYTPLGKLDKDILFWSTMGSSYSYNIFMGLAELVPGVLILFPRTRKLGLFFSFGVFLNVIAINFSFDISVKLFSSFLLLVNIFLLIPTFKTLWQFLVVRNINIIPNSTEDKHWKIKNHSLRLILVVFLLIESLYPYAHSSNFQDDQQQRPYLHGAYEVEQIINDGDTLTSSEFPSKRIFIHRDGFLIFQDQKDQMTDYKLAVDQNKQKMYLTDYEGKTNLISYTFKKMEKTLILRDFDQDKSIIIEAKMLNWRELPLLQGNFHWSVD